MLEPDSVLSHCYIVWSGCCYLNKSDPMGGFMRVSQHFDGEGAWVAVGFQ